MMMSMVDFQNAKGDRCSNPQCVAFNQPGFDVTRGGETFCSECGTQLAFDKKVVGELEFNQGSNPHGRFVRDGIMNSKYVLTCF